jgi:hypothetical protein
MAQIRIEQKRSGLGWLLALIALIILALIIWWFAAGSRSTAGAQPAGASTTAPSSLETP